ncbi:MAG: hypothetical protein O2923_13930 [Verrucomicrobia bacterium]|nr:hypothetical protein [Verrucomicrobiota bacterium]
MFYREKSMGRAWPSGWNFGLVDQDSRLMRKNKRSEYEQAYNAQAAKEPKAEWIKSMKAKLQIDTGRALYARRKQTVEPVFGIIKCPRSIVTIHCPRPPRLLTQPNSPLTRFAQQK